MASWIATDKYIVVKRKRDRYFRLRYMRLMLHNDRAHKETRSTARCITVDDLLRLPGTARNKLERARHLYTGSTTSPWHIELSLLLDASITNFRAARLYPSICA